MAAILGRQPTLSEGTARRYAQTVADQSAQKALDPWTYYAIVTLESTWLSGAFRRSSTGNECYVGLGQLRVADCEPTHVARLLDPTANLIASAKAQQEAKRWCKLHSCPHGWIYLYNPSTKYVADVQRLAQESRRVYAPPQPVVRKLRGGLRL